MLHACTPAVGATMSLVPFATVRVYKSKLLVHGAFQEDTNLVCNFRQTLL